MPVTLHEWLDSAVCARDARYLAIRAQGANLGTSVLTFLKSQTEPESSWPVARTAEMLLTFLTDEPLVLRIQTLMRGQFGRGLPCPAAGTWTAEDRGGEIAALGPAALPPVLEALTKARTYGDDQECEALFVAVRMWKDPRSIDPLTTLLDNDEPSSVRKFAAHTLGRLRATAASDRLVDVASDPAADRFLRRESLRALAWIGDPTVRDRVAELTQDAEVGDLARALESSLGAMTLVLAAPRPDRRMR